MTTLNMTSFLPVDPQDIGFVMGKNGRTMMGVARVHNVVITYKPYNPIYSPDVPPSFMIKGAPSNVSAACDALRDIATENMRRRWVASYEKTKVEHVLEVDAEDIGILIGAGGNTIRTLASNHQVEAFVPRGQMGDEKVNVIIRGYKKSASIALGKAQEIVDEGRRRRGVAAKYDPFDDTLIINQLKKADEEYERLMADDAKTLKLIEENDRMFEKEYFAIQEESSDEEIEVIIKG